MNDALYKAKLDFYTTAAELNRLKLRQYQALSGDAGADKLAEAWIPIDEAAELLGVSRKTIERRIAEGAVEARKLGAKTVRVSRASVLALLKGRR